MIREDADISVLDEEIRAADAVYLYKVSGNTRENLAVKCMVLQKEWVCSVSLAESVSCGINRIDADYDSPVICFCGREKKVQSAIKRGFDIFLSCVALIVLSPVFLAAALCIKLDDHGPVFYTQRRYTKGCREFDIYKFRSMVLNAESGEAVLASKSDPRLTRVGRFMRNLKLDELPQLINILKGDMSIVGPRPERAELIEEALKSVPDFCLRNIVTAGLTGYAQVMGSYNTSFEEKLKWDLMYINNFSLRLDAKIIAMTIPSIFRKENSEDHSKWEIDIFPGEIKK